MGPECRTTCSANGLNVLAKCKLTVSDVGTERGVAAREIITILSYRIYLLVKRVISNSTLFYCQSLYCNHFTPKI